MDPRETMAIESKRGESKAHVNGTLCFGRLDDMDGMQLVRFQSQ